MATWLRRFVNLDGIVPLFINSTFMFAFKWNSILSFWLTNSLLCFLAVNRDTKVAHQLLIYFLIDCRLEELPIMESPFSGVSLCLHFPIYSFVQVSIISAHMMHYWFGCHWFVYLHLLTLAVLSSAGTLALSLVSQTHITLCRLSWVQVRIWKDVAAHECVCSNSWGNTCNKQQRGRRAIFCLRHALPNISTHYSQVVLFIAGESEES